jgi:hypothetical protein
MMATTFDVAHIIREQGVDLIVVFLSSSFGQQTKSVQQQTIAELTACARSAGLAGTVVRVWQDGSRLGFIAPTGMHPFFRSLDIGLLAANINTNLTCG